VHSLLTSVLSPGIGGFFGVYVTSLAFGSVSTRTIYVSFVSILAVILLVLFLMGVISIYLGDSSIGDLVLFTLQALAIFVGAGVGKACLEDVQPAISRA
jgi:hypothetical protein